MKEYFVFAINSIKHRKLRSWLTVLGIIIGIGAIVALISLSQGLENAIRFQFEKVGSNRMYILPGSTSASNIMPADSELTHDDVDTIDAMPEVDWASAYVMGADNVKYGNRKEFNQYIMGLDPAGLEERWSDIDISLESGRLFKSKEKYSAIIGHKTAYDMFDKDLQVNNKIKIKGEKFTVVGILEEIGTEEDDSSIFLPMDIMKEIFEKGDEVNVIEVKIKKGLDINAAAIEIERRLKRKRGDDNFLVYTPEQVLKQLGSMLDIVQIILGGIAGIALVVGGMGIMNSMYTNVLERTKEIGIMKSVGASSGEILLIFLVESGVLGAVGGILGVTFGIAISLIVEFIAVQQGFIFLKIIIDWKLVIFAVVFAFIMGMISGYLPAKQAASLKPVEALRYGQ